MTTTLTLQADGARSCVITIGRGVATWKHLAIDRTGRVAVLHQESVIGPARQLAAEIEAAGLHPVLHAVPDGEEAKSLGTVEAIMEWLNTVGFTRSDMVLGVGGGALTDLAGFVAATYLRGVEVSYLPTTLLGAIDASIGGKTGVNVGGKNLAGVFRHPARVAVDLDILDELPEELLREGAAETVKAGFIADTTIMDAYEIGGLAAPLDDVVPAAISVKAETVAADFTEQGRRAVLNYGHTIGHAIEVAARIPHGHAVSIGMVAAGRVAELATGFAGAARQTAILQGLGLPTESPAVDQR